MPFHPWPQPHRAPPGPQHVGSFLRGPGVHADTGGARAAAQSGPGVSASGETGSSEDMTAIRTFIVEDSPIILDSLVATLEEMAPVQVVGSAPDEASALQRLRQCPDVDLIIIDVFLKSGTGLGVLRGTAGLAAKRVVLTNYATADMREKCTALGAHRVFDKSTDLDELIAYCTRLGDAVPGGSGAAGGRAP